MPQTKHVDIRVTGKVQGVFFRMTAKHVAEGLGLCGTTRNNSDGSVSIEIEGDLDAIQEFIDWCMDGPPKSKIEQIEVDYGSLQYYDDFRIID